jgi:mono/diheme cytochrome c family protein
MGDIMVRTLTSVFALLIAVTAGCRAAEPDPEVPQPPHAWWREGKYLEPHAQRPGDPAKGWDILTTGGYVGCGIPASAFPLLKYVTPVTPDKALAGRTGPAAEFPYKWNYHETDEGVALAVPNCLLCHGGHFNGELVVGLGDVESDFTADFAVVSKAVDFLEPLKDELFTAEEIAELDKFVNRVRKLGNVTKMRTVGANPALQIGVLLFSHRDRHTLEWSEEPLLEIPAEEHIPVDTPAWWHMAKKSTQFYNGMARGDHRKTMMTASSLCVDNNADAEKVNEYFHHVNAFVSSLQPPKYPWSINRDKAAYGQKVFEANCAGCHGFYGEDEHYPNLVIPLEVIKTDPVYAIAGPLLGEFLDWYNESVYGLPEAWLEPNLGYVAPPLDAAWATAPYFHNGSVPNIEAVLDSTLRPKHWKRVDYDSRNYDKDRLGWPYIETPYGQSGAGDDERKFIYDTKLPGHWNTGHTFGDHLTTEQRKAVLEYLKTL